jgi:transcriptional regulator with XRE-family HTH domain
MTMPKRTAQDWEPLEQELHAAGVSAEEIQAGARRLLAENRGHQLAETRKQLGLAQKDLAAALGVSIARISQIEHGKVTSFEVIARYVEALGGRLAWSPTSATGPCGYRSATPQPPPLDNWVILASRRSRGSRPSRRLSPGTSLRRLGPSCALLLFERVRKSVTSQVTTPSNYGRRSRTQPDKTVALTCRNTTQRDAAKRNRLAW